MVDTKGKPLKPKAEKMGISTKAHNTDKSFIAETTTISSAEQLAGGTTPLQDVIKTQTLSNATASRSSQTSEIGSKTLKIALEGTNSPKSDPSRPNRTKSPKFVEKGVKSYKIALESINSPKSDPSRPNRTKSPNFELNRKKSSNMGLTAQAIYKLLVIPAHINITSNFSPYKIR